MLNQSTCHIIVNIGAGRMLTEGLNDTVE